MIPAPVAARAPPAFVFRSAQFGNNLCHIMALTGAVEPLLLALQSLREWRVQARLMERAAPLLIANGLLDPRFQEAQNPILGVLDLVKEQAAAASTAAKQAKVRKEADSIRDKTVEVLEAAKRSADSRIEDMLRKAPLENEERAAREAASGPVVGFGAALGAVKELSTEDSLDSQGLSAMVTEAGPVVDVRSHFAQMSVAVRSAGGGSFKVPVAMVEAPSDDESEGRGSMGVLKPPPSSGPAASGSAPGEADLTGEPAAKLAWGDVVGALEIDKYVTDPSGSDSDSDSNSLSSEDASRRAPRPPRFWVQGGPDDPARPALQAAASVSAFFAASSAARAEAKSSQGVTAPDGVISPREAPSETGSMLAAAADDAVSVVSSIADGGAAPLAGAATAGEMDREDLMTRILDWVEATQDQDDVAREVSNGVSQPAYPDDFLPVLFQAAFRREGAAPGAVDGAPPPPAAPSRPGHAEAVSEALAVLFARPDPPSASEVAAASAALGQAEFAMWVLNRHTDYCRAGSAWSQGGGAAAASAAGAASPVTAAAAEAGGDAGPAADAAEEASAPQLGMDRWWAVGQDPAEEVLGLASERGVTPLMMAAVGGSGSSTALVADMGPAFMTPARAAGQLVATSLEDIVAAAKRAATEQHVKAVVQAMAAAGQGGQSAAEPSVAEAFAAEPSLADAPVADVGQADSPSKVAFSEAEETKDDRGGDGGAATAAGAGAGTGLAPEDSQPWLRDTDTARQKVLLAAAPTSLGPVPSTVFGRKAKVLAELEGTDVTVNFAPPSTSLAEGRGLSPCHVAALLGNADALAALAARGAAVDAELPRSHATPLSLAASGLSGWSLRRLLFSRLNARLLLLAERAREDGDMALTEAFKLKLALLDAGAAPAKDPAAGSGGRRAPLPSGAREVWDMPALPDQDAVAELLSARHERLEGMERRQAGVALAASADMRFLADVDSDVQKALDATWLASGPSKEHKGRRERLEAERAALEAARAQSRRLLEQRLARAELRRGEMLLTKEDGARLLAAQWVPARAEDEAVFVAGLMGIGADLAAMPLREAAAQAAMEAVKLEADGAVLPETEGGEWAVLRGALEAVACELSAEGRREATAGWPLPEDPVDDEEDDEEGDEEADEEAAGDRAGGDTDPADVGPAAVPGSRAPSDRGAVADGAATALRGTKRFAWMSKQMLRTAVSRLPEMLQFCRERAWRELSRSRAVAVLLRHGARVGGAPRAVATPLLLATLSGSVAVVATLAANGASLAPGDVSTPGSFAWAAAHAASPALLLLALRTADGGDICGSESLVAAAPAPAPGRAACGASAPEAGTAAEGLPRFDDAVSRLRPRSSTTLVGLLPLLAAGVPARRCPESTDAVVLKAVDGRETLGEQAGFADGAGPEDEEFRDQAAGDATPDPEAPLLRQTASALLLCASLPAGWPESSSAVPDPPVAEAAPAVWAGGVRTDPQSLALLPLSVEEAEQRMKEAEGGDDDDDDDVEPVPPTQPDPGAATRAQPDGAAAVAGDPTDPDEDPTGAGQDPRRAAPVAGQAATSGKLRPVAAASAEAAALASAAAASDAVLLAAANRLDGALALAAQVCRADVQPTVLGAAGLTLTAARAAVDWCSEGLAGRVCFPAADDVEALPGEAAPVPVQSQKWLDDTSAPGTRFWLVDPSFGFTPEGLREAVKQQAEQAGSAEARGTERPEAILKWVRSAWSVCAGEDMAEALHIAARRGSSGWLLALAPVAETMETRVVAARPFLPSDVLERKAEDVPAWYTDPQALPETQALPEMQAVSLSEAAALSDAAALAPGVKGQALMVARLVAMAPGLVAALGDAWRAALWRDLVAAAVSSEAEAQSPDEDDLAPPKGRSLCGGPSASRAPYARAEGELLAEHRQQRGCDVEACSVQ